MRLSTRRPGMCPRQGIPRHDTVVLLMAGNKYAPLTDLLVRAAHAGNSTMRVDFAELGRVVGGLPTSAYTRREWWANSYLVQAKGWRGAGWRVCEVDLEQEWVLFVREPERSGP
jgi:hypothetical protein